MKLVRKLFEKFKSVVFHEDFKKKVNMSLIKNLSYKYFQGSIFCPKTLPSRKPTVSQIGTLGNSFTKKTV